MTTSNAEVGKPTPEANGVNVGNPERLVSAIAGAGLALAGLRRGTIGGLGLAALGGLIAYRGLSGHCPMYRKVGFTSAKPADGRAFFEHGIHVDVAVPIDRSASDLYAYWRKIENLPHIMDHIQSVEVLDDKRSRWTARGPIGSSITWDAEIINDVPDQTIAWRSLGGAMVDNAGSVRFIPSSDGQGTVLRVVLDYIPPAGSLGNWMARVLGQNPQLQIESDLRKFKKFIEAGAMTLSPNSP